MADFTSWFSSATRHSAPRGWQTRLADQAVCASRLIRVPTGLGKTEGILAAWMWHAVVQARPEWPRRLVWCLPMRVLVEQTATVARSFVERAVGVSGMAKVAVHQVMGGIDGGEWHLAPEAPAVLIGTQDMLLSRALNRGYGAARGRWPVDFGLLNHDCLWIMDEVQLMDVGLTTSVQMQAFRELDRSKLLRPVHSWWMSATLQPDWLDTVDYHSHLQELRSGVLQVPASERDGPLWRAEKRLGVVSAPAKEDKDAIKLADTAWQAHHQDSARLGPRVTVVIVNRVKTALAVHAALRRRTSPASTPDVPLIHARFRGLERRGWPVRFLSRAHSEDRTANRIIVSTQIIEAGVDISATTLVSELAPWPNLVQRFGRCARYGDKGRVIVVDRELSGDECLPYREGELMAARDALKGLSDVGLTTLEDFESSLDPAERNRLYPYDPLHMLTHRECLELFDTGADLTGTDLDISRFIRSGDERDLLVCWISVDWDLRTATAPGSEIQPTKEGLCPVPVSEARVWLFERSHLKDTYRNGVWVWDYQTDEWRRPTANDCYPGQTLLVDSRLGGYDTERGFTGDKPTANSPAIPTDGAVRTGSKSARADLAQSREDLSAQAVWKTIATHGREVAMGARTLGSALGLSSSLLDLFDLAGRVHDWGKSHPAFQTSIHRKPGTPVTPDVAKAPDDAWAPLRSLYCLDDASGPRKGLRHELATVLALFELLRRTNPSHAALLGPHAELVRLGLLEQPENQASARDALGRQLASLDAKGFDLLTYLVCAHHGKVRGSWQSTPHDQDFPIDLKDPSRGQPLRGVRLGDRLPAIRLFADDGQVVEVPELLLYLELAELGLSSRYGASWIERVHSLLAEHGPFTLAFLEAVLRVADVQASRLASPDPLLTQTGGAA